METFKSLREIAPQRIWEGVLARVVEGATMSFALVELAPNSVVAEHQHHNEQMGIVLQGSMTFTIGGEPRLLHTGDTYNIPGGRAAPRRHGSGWSGGRGCVLAGSRRLGAIPQGGAPAARVAVSADGHAACSASPWRL